MRTPLDCAICGVGKILWWSSTLSAVVGHWPTSNCSNMVAGQCWRHPPPQHPPSSFTPRESILQAWPEPLHVLLLIPEWTIAHKIGPFMHLRSLHKDGSLALFSQGFIWLEGFYLKYTDRALAICITHSLWTGGSSLPWGPNVGHQPYERHEAHPFLRLIPGIFTINLR